MSAFSAKPPRQALQAASPIKPRQLEFAFFAGEPVYIAVQDPQHTWIVPVHGQPQAQFDLDRIIGLLRNTGGIAEIQVLNHYDAYYLDRTRQRPLPVILARLSDAGGTRYYIDPRTARVVGNYSSPSWMNRWLYHGLHSLNFPWLYNYRPAWDIVVLVLMIGGASLSVTSVIIGFQVLRRKFSS